jgi:hypothetical protein
LLELLGGLELLEITLELLGTALELLSAPELLETASKLLLLLGAMLDIAELLLVFIASLSSLSEEHENANTKTIGKNLVFENIIITNVEFSIFII